MQTSSSGKCSGVYKVQAEINVTPLVDVMLVLLIIFMVTAPMLTAGLHVNLPKAKAAQKLDPKPPVVLTYGKDGKVELDGQSYDLDQIAAAVEAKLGDDRTHPIQLRADREAAYGDVVGLMDVLAANGLRRLALLTGLAGKTNAAKPDAAAQAPTPAPQAPTPAPQAPTP